MKHFLMALGLFTASFCKAQVTLEHSYPLFTSLVTLSTSGDKYSYNDTTSLYLYNFDHSPWKTITPVLPAGYRLQYAWCISDNLFNSDNNIEFLAVGYSNTLFPHYKAYIASETGTMTYLDSSYSGTIHYNQSPNSYKLCTNTITSTYQTTTTV